MNGNELWLLKQFCERYGLDYEEIDRSLSYWENKDHLQKMVWGSKLRLFGPLETDESGLNTWKRDEDWWETKLQWHMEEHFLEYYVACIELGETDSSDVADVVTGPVLFSLAEYIAGQH